MLRCCLICFEKAAALTAPESCSTWETAA